MYAAKEERDKKERARRQNHTGKGIGCRRGSEDGKNLYGQFSQFSLLTQIIIILFIKSSVLYKNR